MRLEVARVLPHSVRIHIDRSQGEKIVEMTMTTRTQWKEWSTSYTVLPMVHKFAWQGSEQGIVSWRKAWEAASEYSFVLESGKVGRYTFFGLAPTSVIRGKGNLAETTDGMKLEGAPLSVLKQWMAPYQAPSVDKAPKFIGGCVGYLSYDIVRSLERLPLSAEDDLGLPDYVFMRTDEVWVLDHEAQELYCAVHVPWNPGDAADKLDALYLVAQERVQQMKQLWDTLAASNREEDQETRSRRLAMFQEEGQAVLHGSGTLEGMETVFPRADFEQAVRRIQQYIGQGDVFQVNLSLRQSMAVDSTPEQLYEWLRLVNPSPYMGLLRFPDFQIVSASPELLVKLERGRVSTRPIAGTRRRGRTEEEDLRMEEELRTNEKERAEHIMLVDLERNDLGRISRYGSVHVSELMVIERYSHVMHLVSEVEGELAAGKDAYDVLAATFPGGTITGAPKVRTMEIIEELEPVRRGPYTGSFGWIDYNGNMEFNIIIRTVTLKDAKAHIQTGAGIVIDSVPEREYAECLNKAKAMCKAIQLSELEANAILTSKR